MCIPKYYLGKDGPGQFLTFEMEVEMKERSCANTTGSLGSLSAGLCSSCSFLSKA